jgi:hypothetical protein
MSISRIYSCDWRECNHHVQSASQHPPLFLTVTDDAGDALHFCTWDCVLNYAAEKPPCETIPLGAAAAE